VAELTDARLRSTSAIFKIMKAIAIEIPALTTSGIVHVFSMFRGIAVLLLAISQSPQWIASPPAPSSSSTLVSDALIWSFVVDDSVLKEGRAGEGDLIWEASFLLRDMVLLRACWVLCMVSRDR
jgi:hypothetical protein